MLAILCLHCLAKIGVGAGLDVVLESLDDFECTVTAEHFSGILRHCQIGFLFPGSTGTTKPWIYARSPSVLRLGQRRSAVFHGFGIHP